MEAIQQMEVVPVYRHLPFLAVNAMELFQFLTGGEMSGYNTWVSQGFRKSRAEEGTGYLHVPEYGSISLYLAIPTAQMFNRVISTPRTLVVSDFLRLANTWAKNHTVQALAKVQPESGMPVLFDQGGVQAVSARELCEKLGLDLSNWSRWYKKNILDNQFAIENEDYFPFVIETNAQNQAFNPNQTRDFALSIDFAKRIAMMARTEQGEKIRKYFIECERVARTTVAITRVSPQISELEARIKQLEAQTAPVRYFTVAEYAKANQIKLKPSDSSRFGQLASRMCQDRGLQTGELPHGKVGKVKTYPNTILEAIFKA